jgi:hypothetical protein
MNKVKQTGFPLSLKRENKEQFLKRKSSVTLAMKRVGLLL